MGPETAPATPPPPYPPPQPAPSRRRLTRSSRERLWAGVAGGLAEYFDIDPTLVRFLWIAATVVSGGLAIPVYILAWIIMPRDDRPSTTGQYPWRDWSQEFHSETQRLADEARRVAGEARETWRPNEPGPSVAPATPTPTPAVGFGPEPFYTADRPRHHARSPRSGGILLVGLGVLLLAANTGIFNWVEWRMMWPLIFIGLGVILLARQSDWGR
jgi:phage shock protein C